MRFKHATIAAVLVLLAYGETAFAQDDEGGLSVDPDLQRPAVPELEIPAYDAARGRALFVTKGCVVCHAVNDVGGEAIRDLGGDVAPALDASRMPIRMDPFAFFARMWRGADTMIALQEQRLGYQIALDGDELADIMAFVYDAGEQEKFTPDSFTPPVFWYRDKAENTPDPSLASTPDGRLAQDQVR